MTTPTNPRDNEHPSTYFVQDRKNEQEFTRLKIHNRLVNAVMGGILPEQPDPTIFHQVLDIGCGPGGWLIEAAKTYPTMSRLEGIDISTRMVHYARTQAESEQVSDRVKFHVMDTLRMLEFPPSTFDLVNLRFAGGYIRTWDWQKLLTEIQRVMKTYGVVRITDAEAITPSNSVALTRLLETMLCALSRAGHFFEETPTGFVSHFAPLLTLYGYQQVQTRVVTVEYEAGTETTQAFREDVKYIFQTTRPFLDKWGCVPQDYNAIYQQALDDMQKPDFHATWNFHTAWGTKINRRN
jgi:ubiquinone/menaquinone biosynthesis C-methylase UbiE